MNTIREKAKLDKKIARQEKRVARLTDRLTTKLNNDLRPAYNTILSAITNAHLIDQPDLHITNGNRISSIDPVTGALRDYLVYFPEYNTISRIHYYLEAYLITNEDVLEEHSVRELKELMTFLNKGDTNNEHK